VQIRIGQAHPAVSCPIGIRQVSLMVS
jgi:hypothetical protein